MLANIKCDLKAYYSAFEFQPFLEQLRDKYLHYGTCKGTITLTPTAREAEKLSLALGMHIKSGVQVKIPITKIQKALDESRFEGISVDELLILFYPQLKSNKEIVMEKERYIEEKIIYLGKQYRCFSSLLRKEEATQKIRYLILHDEELLSNILKALEQLPLKEFTYLAIFSSHVTGNPHYYDLDTKHLNLLVTFIGYFFDISFVNNRNGKKEVLEQVGIITDEVSNFVITYALKGNPMLDSFFEKRTPLTINLANIRAMNQIEPIHKKLLIVENPSFLSRVIGKKLDYSVIVTSGNSNLVIYKLLEKMKDVTIYFNGDFDPEGLLIAQNFKDRYPALVLVGYNKDYYRRGLSANIIRKSRLKKLDHVKDSELTKIKELLLEHQCASYQEANYDNLLEEMETVV